MMDPWLFLAWLRTRRSVRRFVDRPVPREVLIRVLAAAGTAPSSTNRQPWRFSVLTAAAMKRRVAEAIRTRVEAVQAIVRRSHHADDFANYGDFFHEPLQSAAAVIVPQFRSYPDLIAGFLGAAGEDPARFTTAAAMEHERCSAAAAVMALLLQAHAEGLGACWMAGPMLAEKEITSLLAIREPWKMLGAIALGYADETPVPKSRKEVDKITVWFEDGTGETA